MQLQELVQDPKFYEDFRVLLVVALSARLARTELAMARSEGRFDPRLETAYDSLFAQFKKAKKEFCQKVGGEDLKVPKFNLDEVCNLAA